MSEKVDVAKWVFAGIAVKAAFDFVTEVEKSSCKKSEQKKISFNEQKKTSNNEQKNTIVSEQVVKSALATAACIYLLKRTGIY